MSASVTYNRLVARARLRHLQVLVRLADLGSVKRTAEAIGLSQPAVTHLLADLERLVEVTLFQRHARGVRPSAAAEELLPLARRILATAAQGAQALAARRDRGAGTVRLAASTAAVNGFLARTLPAFTRMHPDILVHVSDLDNSAPAIESGIGDADLVACREPEVLPEGWRFCALADDRYAIVTSPGAPLARRRRVRLAELGGEHWLLPPTDSAAHRTFDALVERLQWQPRLVQVVTRNLSLTWAMLAADASLMLVPYSVVRQLVEARQLAELRIDEPMPFTPIGLLSREAGGGAAAARLAEFLARHREGDARALAPRVHAARVMRRTSLSAQADG